MTQTYIIDKVQGERHSKVDECEPLAVDCDRDCHVGAQRVGGYTGAVSAGVRAVIICHHVLPSLYIQNHHPSCSRRRQNLGEINSIDFKCTK